MRVLAWYGLAGEIDVEGPRWHVVRVAGVPLGQPPLVNLALRRGLAADERARLSGLHELGHLQTLLLALAHGMALVWMGVRRRRAGGRRIGWLTAALVAHHAAWEFASEAYVVAREGVAYRDRYRRRPNRLVPLFWIARAPGPGAERVAHGISPLTMTFSHGWSKMTGPIRASTPADLSPVPSGSLASRLLIWVK
jgi:hypothetical protein